MTAVEAISLARRVFRLRYAVGIEDQGLAGGERQAFRRIGKVVDGAERRTADATVVAPLFVGDSPHDMTAGRAAGVVTVAALWGPFTRPQLAVARPDYYIKGARELLPIVERVAEELEEASLEDLG